MPKHARTDENTTSSFGVIEEVDSLTIHNSASEQEDSEGFPETEDMLTSEDSETAYPDALDSLVPDADEPPLLFDSSEQQLATISSDAWDSDKKKGKNKKHLTIYQKKSRRMRRVLIVVISLLLLLIGALVYFVYVGVQEYLNPLVQQTVQQEPPHDVDELKDTNTNDGTTATEKTTEVPLLTSLLGKTQEEAITFIGHGATIVSSTPVNEENNAVKMNVKISLTDEPGDSRSGTPTVYLGLNEAGAIVTAGYSAATSSLGYGAFSFTDAIKNQSIIEKTLAEAGLTIPVATVVLPTDKATYSEYASDGTTLTKESYSFSGLVAQEGINYEWSAVLRYDYAAANASGNLADTIRQIYVYVNTAGATIAPAAAAQNPEGQTS